MVVSSLGTLSLELWNNYSKLQLSPEFSWFSKKKILVIIYAQLFISEPNQLISEGKKMKDI
jgi:hypothetical protein